MRAFALEEFGQRSCSGETKHTARILWAIAHKNKAENTKFRSSIASRVSCRLLFRIATSPLPGSPLER